MARGPIRVFVSYTHESDSHDREVLGLASRLRADGVDARSDHLVKGTPDRGWPAWMESQVAQADFIVLVCTPTYYESYKQVGDPNTRLGSRWETSLVRGLIYQDGGRQSNKFIPVLPTGSTVDDIPDPLRTQVTHYQLSDYQGLLRHVTGRPGGGWDGVEAPWEPPRSPIQATDSYEPRWFSETITEQYLEHLDQRVQSLTDEQFAVISQLHGRARALISGNPGSGKTLVAAEKAIRLADAGIKTLLLCHNPLLAEWLGELTWRSAVDVRPFEDLVRNYAFDPEGDEEWSNYSQPTSEQLDRALAGLRASGDAPYQAVIVDEGQDFADDWWPIVEACLSDGSTLYVFFDERQSLLPGRIHLPPSGWPLTLSRNCRNAGRIYEVMRHLSPGSPPVDEVLRDLGHVEFFQAERLRDAVNHALQWCEERDALDSAVAILGGGVDFENSVLAHGPFAYEDPFNWQGLVRREIGRLTAHWQNELQSAGIGSYRLALVRGLSRAPNPSPADIQLVGNVASTIAGALAGRPAHFVEPEVYWSPVETDGSRRGEIELKGPKSKVSPLERLNALRCDAWVRSLPETGSASFAHHRSATGGEIPVYHLGEIKGLERDVVLLVLQGDAPQFDHHLFVGISRARAVLAVVGDERAYRALPSWLRPGAQESARRER